MTFVEALTSPAEAGIELSIAHVLVQFNRHINCYSGFSLNPYPHKDLTAGRRSTQESLVFPNAPAQASWCLHLAQETQKQTLQLQFPANSRTDNFIAYRNHETRA